MDARAAKLALARKKLKDHQEKKSTTIPVDENSELLQKDDTKEQIPVSDEPVLSTETHRNGNDTDHGPPFIQTSEHNVQREIQSLPSPEVNVTEMLISSKRNLEIQINELQSKLSQLESNYTLAVNNNNVSKQQIYNLQTELKNVHDKYLVTLEEMSSKNKMIQELYTIKSSLSDKTSNLQDQLEFTKSILSAKEMENNSLMNQLGALQNQLDVTQLQLQQVSNGAQVGHPALSKHDTDQNSEHLLQKISSLELQLKSLQKERDQINLHYEHYVGELNEQLKSLVTKNEEMSREINNLSIRETNLIDQISEMEIRLQNYRIKPEPVEEQIRDVEDINALQQNYNNIQEKYQELSIKYDELQKQYAESETKVNELSQMKENECNHDNISISKLNADITSDKIAAQRATEQNKKLKTDLQELEEAFVKISRDKLELTEKLAAEKYLNRELTIKLAEIDEKAKDMHIKLMAKDEEMIRLQTNYREIERKFEKVLEEIKQSKENMEPQIQNDAEECHEVKNHDGESHLQIPNITRDEDNNLKIPKEDAMLKLQERFYKIMGEVADLSDEKHRLEHIILQLQNETDTICEYVALYQQQRSLLNKRDEERGAQIKIFQSECALLRSQIEELSGILIRLVEDKELKSYFQIESRCADAAKIMNLLSHLKSNSLIDPNRKISELKDFYPCSCCSGKLIDV